MARARKLGAGVVWELQYPLGAQEFGPYLGRLRDRPSTSSTTRAGPRRGPAFRLSKVGYVVATREVSIVLSAVIGSVMFGERGQGPRLVAAAVVFAGVACVALAR